MYEFVFTHEGIRTQITREAI